MIVNMLTWRQQEPEVADVLRSKEKDLAATAGRTLNRKLILSLERSTQSAGKG